MARLPTLPTTIPSYASASTSMPEAAQQLIVQPRKCRMRIRSSSPPPRCPDIAKEQKDIRGSNEDLNKAKESLKELEDKKKELREAVGKVVEYGKEILKDPLDPESYQTLLTDASKYLEGKVLDFLVGDYFGPQLEEARKALGQLPRRKSTTSRR